MIPLNPASYLGHSGSAGASDSPAVPIVLLMLFIAAGFLFSFSSEIKAMTSTKRLGILTAILLVVLFASLLI